MDQKVEDTLRNYYKEKIKDMSKSSLDDYKRETLSRYHVKMRTLKERNDMLWGRYVSANSTSTEVYDNVEEAIENLEI